ncbi:hypothetical protein GCM10023231_39530 [Olivibacter ginsenosidimutans]|uniref:Secreted protein n=1 Tax=Olivibacter ginsenosidimutans TaxID=1176537 RepID=A0ABP9CAV1_9SPHI
MLKRFVAIVLLIALIGSNFSRFFIYAGFELNKKYIASTLCENRDKPWMHCDGNCYFMKKIKQAQENEKDQQKQLQRNLFQEVCIIHTIEIKFANRLLRVINTPYPAKKTRVIANPLFHPPKIA